MAPAAVRAKAVEVYEHETRQGRTPVLYQRKLTLQLWLLEEWLLKTGDVVVYGRKGVLIVGRVHSLRLTVNATVPTKKSYTLCLSAPVGRGLTLDAILTANAGLMDAYIGVGESPSGKPRYYAALPAGVLPPAPAPPVRAPVPVYTAAQVTRNAVTYLRAKGDKFRALRRVQMACVLLGLPPADQPVQRWEKALGRPVTWRYVSPARVCLPGDDQHSRPLSQDDVLFDGHRVQDYLVANQEQVGLCLVATNAGTVPEKYRFTDDIASTAAV